MSAFVPRRGRIRKRGREGITDDALSMLDYFLDWEPLHEHGDHLPTLEPGSAGRPPDFPPVMAIIFMFLYFNGAKTQRGVSRMLRNPKTWAMVRSRLAHRYPDYPGFGPDAAPYDRSDYARYVDRYGVGESTFRDLYQEFIRSWGEIAQWMGMFDPNNGSKTHPHPHNLLAGDMTVLRSMYNAAPGDTFVDPTTGEIKPKRFDPDAGWYTTGDRRSVYGTKFGFLIGALDNDGERLVLGMFGAEDGGHEPAEGMRALRCVEQLRPHLPGLQGLVYDKALRGKHVQMGFEMNVPVFAKVAKTKGDKVRSRNLGPSALHLSDNTTEAHSIWAIDGAPHIEVMVAGAIERVRLERGQIYVRANANGPSRWYCNYTVPTTPEVPQRLQGARLALRLDRPDGESDSWTEVLRGIPEGDPDWGSVYGRRNSAETINRWFKDFTRDNRAPCVGRAKQRFALLCGALAANFKALLTYCKRRGIPLPTVAGPP